MILVGLTGGIGSGKSTVSALLEAKGAVIVDADAITRELQQPGTPVFEAMVERFGEGTRMGVVPRVVGHQMVDLDAERGEVFAGAGQEPGTGDPPLIGQRLDVGKARAIIIAGCR